MFNRIEPHLKGSHAMVTSLQSLFLYFKLYRDEDSIECCGSWRKLGQLGDRRKSEEGGSMEERQNRVIF